MSLLDKLNFQTVSRQIERDPVTERRARFRAGIAEQRLVLAALVKGEAYTDPIVTPPQQQPAPNAQSMP